MFVGVLAVFLIMSFLVSLVCAEKLDIEVGNAYVPGEDVVFKIVLYDDDNVKMDEEVNFIIQDYYTDVVKEGIVSSGEEVIFKLPENAWQGPWKITASYNDVSINRLFNVGELEKAEITLEEDILILRNVGNTVYDKKILIYIGRVDQTAQVFLEIGQTKRIKLTAPNGDYDVKVIEGNEENILEFKGVELTGNVVGLESVLGNSFWRKYPMVGLFLGAVGLVVIIILGLKIHKKVSK